jgi:hypothetical protein
VELSKYKFQILTQMEQLKLLKENPHYVSANFKGFNYFLIFMKLKHQNKTFMIDRRKLKYQQKDVDLKEIIIYEIKMILDLEIFNGTILDGKLISSNQNYGFVIMDCYYLKNQDITGMDLKKKYLTLENIFIINETLCQNFTLKMNQIFNYEDLEQLINEILPTYKTPLNGIVFLPKYSGLYYLFNETQKVKVDFNQENLTSITPKVNQEYDMIRDLTDYLSQRTYHYENFNKKKTFWLLKTDIPDIYHLKENTKNDKVELALIPSLKISHQVKSWLNHHDIHKVECVYHQQFNKWIHIILI